MLSLGGSTTAAEDRFDPGMVIRATVDARERLHLPGTSLNDELSRRWLRTFLDRLDPNRLYFLKADFEEFQAIENRVGALARTGDFQFPQLVRERYQRRVSEAVAVADHFLSYEKHDYSVKEKCPTRFEGYATDGDELSERWRLHLKWAMLIEMQHGRKPSDVHSQLAGRYQRIARQACEMSDECLSTVYLDALMASCDPRAGFFSPTYLTQFETFFRIRTYSLGIGLRQRSGQFVIDSIRPSLRDATTQRLIGWNVIAISRLDGETIDLIEMWPDEIYELIRRADGPLESDTEVILDLMNPVTFERITMSWIRIPSF